MDTVRRTWRLATTARPALRTALTGFLRRLSPPGGGSRPVRCPRRWGGLAAWRWGGLGRCAPVVVTLLVAQPLVAQQRGDPGGTSRPSVALGDITGRVVDAADPTRGVPRATVCLGGTKLCTTTSAQGTYRLAGVPWGRYVVIGTAADYGTMVIGAARLCAAVDSGVTGTMERFSENLHPYLHTLAAVDWRDSVPQVTAVPVVVVDPWYHVITAAQVCLKGTSTCGQTNAEGQVVFSHVPWGTIAFTVQVPGYVLEPAYAEYTLDLCGETTLEQPVTLWLTPVPRS